MSYCAVRARQVGPILKLVRSASNATTIRTSVVGPTVEKETHTGQVWDPNDLRMARFVDRDKQINTKFAIDLIAEIPPIACEERVVSCDGGGGPLGHPKVFINLDKPGNHCCDYCGLRFFKEDHH